MIAAVIAKIVEALFGGVLRTISGWFAKREYQAQGAQAQAARDTAAAEGVEAAMAQAVADAPKSKDGALERLRKGTA